MYLMQSSTASVLCESMAETDIGFELETGTAGTGCSWQVLLFMVIKCKARVTLSARCFRKLSGENCNTLSDLNLQFRKDPLFRSFRLLDEFCFSIFCSIVDVMELGGRSEGRKREREKREIKRN